MTPGPKKKPGYRYRNGHLTRSAIAEDVMETATQARMRIFGISKDDAQCKVPSGDKEAKAEQRLGINWGFPLGRLYKIGYIQKDQFIAGNTFAEHMRSYMLSKGIGAATAAAFDMDRRGASLSERPVQHESEARQYMEALAEIDRLNPSNRSATAMMWDTCMSEGSEHFTPKEMGIFREGLNAIARVIARREKMRKAA
jgi:hypothetical protein